MILRLEVIRMFRLLAEAFECVVDSKREVELRIKARAQSVLRGEMTPVSPVDPSVAFHLNQPRVHQKGRTIYTSSLRYWRK
jgi:hypothetical protein